jgi:phospholipid/cholesterol/gamma-HCH transport system substrate-binding protein
MKATTGQKIRTGIFALVGIFLLVGAVFLIGKSKNMFGDTFHVYGTFRNVGGLQAGNNIRFVGVNVGTVESIRIISDTEARVDMILEEKVHPYIKSNAIASIGSDGLMGDKLIVISASEDGTALIKDNARIATTNPTDMGEIVAKMERVADNAEVITAGLADIATQVSGGKGTLGRLLYNDDIADNLEGTVDNIKKGTKGFSENMEALKGNFLLRGYYRRKERKRREKEEARQEQQQQAPQPAEETKSKKKKK